MSRFDRGHALSVVRRFLAGLFALSWFGFPGFGLIDLSVTWDPDWPQMLEAGWGLYMTLFVGIPFTAIAVRPRAAAAAAVQLYVAAGALIVSAIPALEWQLTVLGAAIVVETVMVTGPPSLPDFEPPRRGSWHPLWIPAVIGTIPWLVYAIAMWDLNRQDRIDGDITIGIDHYSVQGAFGLVSILLVTVAALWPTGRVLIGMCVGLSALYLGLVSWVWHPTPASFNQTWSGLCVLWGCAVSVLSAFPTSHRAPLSS